VTYRLDWSRASSDEDKRALEGFICTDAPTLPGVAEPSADDDDAWWESDVEINLQEVGFPLERGEYILLGRDSEGLAAVSWCWEQRGPQTVKILAIAVAQRLRQRHECWVGDEALQRTIDEVMGRADSVGIPVAMIWGEVHSRNGDSLKLFERNRFFQHHHEGEMLEVWLRIDLPRRE
jgi:hypothetical protein